jgi:hypothetical protein
VAFPSAAPKRKDRKYNIVIFPVVLYGYESWAPRLRAGGGGGGGPTPRRSVKRAPRIILFGPKMEEVTGGWRKLHKEELRNLYLSLNIIRMNKRRDII